MSEETKKDVGTAVQAEKQKELTPPEKVKLFEQYEKADARVMQAEAALESARAAKSLAVKAVVEKLGARKYVWKGKKLMPMHRGENWYFRMDAGEAEEIG